MNRAHHLALPLFVAIAAASLGACKGGDKPQAPATGAPEGKPGIMVKDARLVLPAVSGNPGAAYFVLDNQSKSDVTIATVAIDGAGKTELHAPDMKVLDGGGRAEAMTHLDFTPGGAHVMVFDVGGALKAGGETEMTITFADGDKVSVPAKIEAMGAGAMADMPGMGGASEAPKP
ncbi:MAG: copper chaperone PCu(A)C [Novosphingobium sp.]